MWKFFGRGLALFVGMGAAACGGTTETGSTSGAGGEGGTSSAASGTGGGDSGCEGTTSAASSGAGGEGGALVCAGPSTRFVTHAISACFGPGEAFGHEGFPAAILGPPVGAGCCAGSLDVVSLGNGGSITVAFEGNAIVDGPGVDFLVFENAFDIGGDPTHPYAELATVEVSPDGVTWTPFPCVATKFPYGACAGWRPVHASTEASIDPLDPAVAGGDPYDLADLGVPLVRFVRITDRAELPGSFDLDAIAIINAQCP